MPSADRPIRAAFAAIAALATIALGGCNQQHQPQGQNIVIDNEIDANAEVETLPADESSTTPSNQLVNGDDSSDVNDLDAESNSY